MMLKVKELIIMTGYANSEKKRTEFNRFSRH